MITKKIIKFGMILLTTHLMFSTIAFAEINEENVVSENSEQQEVIEEEFVKVECIFRHEFDSMTEQEKDDLKDYVCDEIEVSTEELAAEVYTDESIAEQTSEVGICIPPLDYDSMTDAERAAVDSPLCDE